MVPVLAAALNQCLANADIWVAADDDCLVGGLDGVGILALAWSILDTGVCEINQSRWKRFYLSPLSLTP